MRETGSTEGEVRLESDSEAHDSTSTDYEDEDEDEAPDFDWIVFLFRVAALVTFGATLITSIDLSRNQDVEWQTVMRLSILPFVGGMLVLAAGELIDRRGD